MAKQSKKYSELLLDPRWQKKRLGIFNRDEFTCQICKSTEKTLNVHHIKYNGREPWDIEDEFLVTYCSDCHSIVEYFKNVLNVSKVRLLDNYEGELFYAVYGRELDVFVKKGDENRCMFLASKFSTTIKRECYMKIKHLKNHLEILEEIELWP